MNFNRLTSESVSMALAVISIMLLLVAANIDTTEDSAKLMWEKYVAESQPGRIRPMPNVHFYDVVQLSTWRNDMLVQRSSVLIDDDNAKGGNANHNN